MDNILNYRPKKHDNINSTNQINNQLNMMYANGEIPLNTSKNYNDINQLRPPAVKFCRFNMQNDILDYKSLPYVKPLEFKDPLQVIKKEKHTKKEKKELLTHRTLPVSCGALLYTCDPHGQLGVILGVERTESYGYLPFKGRPEANETYEQAAIREVYEETCGLVQVDHIDLCHQFQTVHKRYFIGLIKVPYDIIEKFEIKRATETSVSSMEKLKIKFFPLNQMQNREIHPLSRLSIKFWLTEILKN
jgi:8-oxo-dGTP pyrophosphatase MutT (NUDIX family)